MLVDHDVEAEDLEAHGVVQIFGLARPVQVRQVRLAGRHGLDNDVLDLTHQLLFVGAVGLEDAHDGCQTALVPTVFITV